MSSTCATSPPKRRSSAWSTWSSSAPWRQRASDIHIEPFENRLKVRYRIDGVLEEVESPPASLDRRGDLARQDHGQAQHRRAPPAAGRPHHAARAGQGTRPARQHGADQHGESVVMRILDRESWCWISRSSASPTFLPRFQKVLEQPHGILLVTGPTGSGKTTTLYTALSKLNTPDVKIITVEDPVEYQIEGINQIQAKPQIGLDFSHALRSIVRQDPDIIMIGEMRDLETAKIAIQSALTGHLVLSTLHTNNAAGGITRLLDMGVEDYLLTSTVNGILAQRLVRRVEPTHAAALRALPEVIAEVRPASNTTAGRPIRLYQADTVQNLTPTGYLGRTTIMEFLVMTDDPPSLVMQHAGMGEIETGSRARSGMRTMYEDGLPRPCPARPRSRKCCVSVRSPDPVCASGNRERADGDVPLQGGERATAKRWTGQMEAASQRGRGRAPAGWRQPAGRGEAGQRGRPANSAWNALFKRRRR
jgi:general secretion pathway protein E